MYPSDTLQGGLGHTATIWVSSNDSNDINGRHLETHMNHMLKDFLSIEWKVNGPKKTGQLRIKEHTGFLGYMGDYTTQFFGDCNKPL